MTEALEALLVLAAQGVEPGVGAAAGLHVELVEGIARAGGRRRTEHLDLGGGQRLVDLAPGRVRVGDQRGRVRRVRDLLGKRQVDLLAGEVHHWAALALGERETVIAHPNLEDVAHAILAAALELRGVHATRGVHDIGVLRTDAVAEQFDATARAGAFDLGCLEATLTTELLGDRGGEGVDGRGTDHINEVAARLCRSDRRQHSNARGRSSDDGEEAGTDRLGHWSTPNVMRNNMTDRWHFYDSCNNRPWPA